MTILAHQWSLPAATAPLHTTGAVGGAVYSQHQYGRAADIRVSGVPVEQLAAYAETLLPGTGGIGRYPAKGFVHVDVRKAKSRWAG